MDILCEWTLNGSQDTDILLVDAERITGQIVGYTSQTYLTTNHMDMTVVKSDCFYYCIIV